MNNSQEYHNVSTFYITVAVLNLGRIDRMLYFANNKRFLSEIRNHPERILEHLVLPYLVMNNPGHISRFVNRLMSCFSKICAKNMILLEFSV